MILVVSSLPQVQQEVQQRKILYMGLYFLIWGEAANVRFMPECLCYIFHNVSIFVIFYIWMLVSFLSFFSSLNCMHTLNIHKFSWLYHLYLDGI